MDARTLRTPSCCPRPVSQSALYSLKVHNSFSAPLERESHLLQTPVRAPPHALWLLGKGRRYSRIAAEALPDHVGTAICAIQGTLALASVGNAITMPAQEIALRTVQLNNAPTARGAIYDSRANKIRPDAAITARNINHTDSLNHILPIAGDADAIR